MMLTVSISVLATDDSGDRPPRLETADLGRDLRDRFLDERDRRHVWRQRDSRMMPETMLRRQRLVAENVERRAGEAIVVEQREQIVVDQEPARPNVEHVRPL